MSPGLLARAARCCLVAIAIGLMLAGCGGGDSQGADKARAAVVLAAALPAVEPQSGIWWNPAAPGSGYAIEHQGNQVSIGAYMYEVNGRPVWYLGMLSRQDNGSYSGQLFRYSGGQTLAGAYRPPSGNTFVADVTLTAQSATSATLDVRLFDSWTYVPITIERFSYSSPAYAPSVATFEAGLWWNESESGRGFFIDLQGARAVMGAFMYDDSGQPVWYIASGAISNGNSFQGTLEPYSGGQSLTGLFKPSVSGGSAGKISVTALSSTTAELVLPSGNVVPLKRFYPGRITTNPPALGGTDNGCYDLAQAQAEGTHLVVTQVERGGDAHDYETKVSNITVDWVTGGMVSFQGNLARETVRTIVRSTTTSFSGSYAAWADRRTDATTENRSYSLVTGEGERTSYGYVSRTTAASNGSTITYTATDIYSPPYVDRMYALGIGESMTAIQNNVLTITASTQPVTNTQSYTITTKYVGRESISVPAGIYETCKFEKKEVPAMPGVSPTITTSWVVVGTGIEVQRVYRPTSVNSIVQQYVSDLVTQATTVTLNGQRL